MHLYTYSMSPMHTFGMQISAPGLWPFTEDKQTVLLVALQKRYQAARLPIIYFNVTDTELLAGPAPSRGSRRHLLHPLLHPQDVHDGS